MIEAVIAFPLAFALTLPLERLEIPTTVEGHPVTLYLTGTAEVSLAQDGADIDMILSLDIADLQQKFSTIVRSRTASDACEYQLTTRAASLRWTGTNAEVASAADGELWECAEGKPTKLLRRDSGAVRLSVAPSVTADSWASFTVTTTRAEGPDRLRQAIVRSLAGTALATDVTNALGGSLSRRTLIAPLPPDLRALEPKIREIAIVGAADSNLELRIVGSIHVPAEKVPALLAWATGG